VKIFLSFFVVIVIIITYSKYYFNFKSNNSVWFEEKIFNKVTDLPSVLLDCLVRVE
jgi:hypothetical protein